MVLLSIIVPVYNKVEFINSCIKSITSQTIQDIEIILVNDGSTDGSKAMCEELKNEDSRIKVIHQENKGVSEARNIGLSIANGNYIGFVDADDIIKEDMYELLIKNLENYNADISVCSIQQTWQKESEKNVNSSTKIKVLDQNIGIEMLLNGTLNWSANNKIYKADLAKSIKFEGSINEDLLFVFNVFLLSRRIVFQDSAKYKYITRENSVSVSKFNKKYLQTITVTNIILQIITDKQSSLINQAKVINVIANLTILNLILLSGKKRFQSELKLVEENLKKYEHFIRNHESLSFKHKLAFKLYAFNSNLYTNLLRAYCKIAKNDALRRI